MRAFFSTIFIVSVFALSANAAAVEKSPNSTADALCISDLKSVGEQLDFVKTEVDGFNIPLIVANSVGIIHTQMVELVSRITKASADCKAISGSVKNDGVVENVRILVPKFNGTMISLSNKKSQFDIINFATDTFRNDLTSLYNATLDLSLAVQPKPTPNNYDRSSPVTAYTDQIINAIISAMKSYKK